MGQELDCPFCSPQEGEKVLASELCYTRWDKYPVTEGHLLIIPNRHVADYFSATAEDKAADTITSTNTESPKIGR